MVEIHEDFYGDLSKWSIATNSISRTIANVQEHLFGRHLIEQKVQVSFLIVEQSLQILV